MKRILTILILSLSLTTFAQKRENIVSPEPGDVFSYPELKQFIGTWQGKLEGEQFTLVFTETQLSKIPTMDFTLEEMIGYHEFKKGGNIESSSLADRQAKATAEKFTVRVSFFPLKKVNAEEDSLGGSISWQKGVHAHDITLTPKGKDKMLMKITQREGLVINTTGKPVPRSNFTYNRTYTLTRISEGK